MADLILDLIIPEINIVETRRGFLEVYPNTEKNEDGSHKYTDKEWVELKIQWWVNRVCRKGWVALRDRDAEIIEDVFEVGGGE